MKICLLLSINICYLFPNLESDHCLPLSVTNSPHSCLVNFIDVTLACEDANSKLVDVVTVADEDPVGNNLLQISKLRFGKKKKLIFCSYFEHKQT